MSIIAKWGRRGSVACEGVKKNYTPFSSLTSRGKCTFCKYRKWQDVCMGNCKSSSKTSAVSKKMTTATKPPLRTFLQGLSYQFPFLGSLCSSLNLLNRSCGRTGCSFPEWRKSHVCLQPTGDFAWNYWFQADQGWRNDRRSLQKLNYSFHYHVIILDILDNCVDITCFQ